jgi:hypothetical protein
MKKIAINLDLDKIEIDTLSDSMLHGLQGGYRSQAIGLNTLCLSADNHCYSDGQTYCGGGCPGPTQTVFATNCPPC